MSTERWLDAQYSVLGSVLIEPRVAPEVMAATTAEDFSGPCATVYAAMRKLFLAGVEPDPVSVADALGPGYHNFLAQLMDVTPTAASVGRYIALCREQSRVTRVREIARSMETAESSEDLRKMLEDASGLMVDKPSLRIVTMGDALRSFMDRHTRQVEYLTWPVAELNDRLYAELGDMIVIGGYPSSGKSAWALQCAWHWAKRYRVGFFSLETSSEKLFDRQMAAAARLSMDDIKRNSINQDGWDNLCGMTQEIVGRNLELIPAAGMSPSDIRAIIMMRGYQIVLVDYLQLLQGNGENRTAQVTSISIALHTMAQSMGVTVVALSQLARPAQGMKQSAPDMSALRESGQIEQDADIIMMLSLRDKDDPAGFRELRIRKNKEGTCPNILLAFEGKYQTFSKAQQTGETIGKLKAAAKKAQRESRKQSGPMDGQYSMLPDDTPVPF